MNATHLRIAVQAAHRGAAQLMHHWQDFSVREKAPKDLVTNADLASQTAIFGTLRDAFPDHFMVGEEEGCHRPPREIRDGTSDTPCWIVDPLDGTLNYVHRLHGFCVSIALVAAGRLQVGVVLDPVRDELFVASRGQGAFLSRVDGSGRRPLATSRCAEIRQSLVACSFPAGVRKTDLEVTEFVAMLEACQSLRRLGSCALTLAYLADGRLDGYWARSVKSWDMAAGALMIDEAGGAIGAPDAGPLDVWDAKFIAAGTPPLQHQMRCTLDAIRSA